MQPEMKDSGSDRPTLRMPPRMDVKRREPVFTLKGFWYTLLFLAFVVIASGLLDGPTP